VLMGPRPGIVLQVLDVTLPRPRSEYDARAHPEFIRLRTHLLERIRSAIVI